MTSSNNYNLSFIDDLLLSLDWYDGQDLIRKNHILYQSKGKFMLLIDSSQKIEEVSKMTTTLKKEYLYYNSKEVSIKDLDNLIQKLLWWCGGSNDETNGQMIDAERFAEYHTYINQLKQIKLELKLQGLLN